VAAPRASIANAVEPSKAEVKVFIRELLFVRPSFAPS